MHIIQRDYENGYHDRFLTRESPNSQRNRNRLQKLLTYKDHGRLLEIGCGKGGFLKMAEKHFDIEGVDISQAVVEMIRPHFGSRVNVLNIEQRPLAGGNYNMVAGFNVLEHLRQPDKAVKKLFRALAPGGLIFGSVPNNFGFVGGAATLLSNFFDRTHVSTFSPDTWKRIFHTAGFTEITFFGEVTLGPNISTYCDNRLWQHLSFNLMFICSKP